ncbi:CHAD domain-containing protein [Microbacterium sp. B2969]|uniref:CHAD domain-containing protein n=1 Tax=Microbacterium alkaliflavum TaxID=3248839 RepID=A0ABW7Q7S2_9MICO
MRVSTATPTVAELITDALRTAAAEVEATEPAALADEPDGVHQQRVRVRRLRSVLAGFGPLLDDEEVERLRVRFHEWGGDLGVVRDIEVRVAVAEDAIERAGVDDERVSERLVDSERRAYAGAHARLVEIARSARAAERTRQLREFVAAPAIMAEDAEATAMVAVVLRAQARRVRKAIGRLDASEESYHDVRKAARRMRYVAEAIARAAPEMYATQVADLADAGDALHDALGGHRDAVLFAESVARAAIHAARAGEPAEAYGRIEAQARREAAGYLRELPHALGKLRRAASALR